LFFSLIKSIFIKSISKFSVSIRLSVHKQFNDIMKPTKAGQIARFHTPFSDEDPNQLYVVLEVMEDDQNPRADIRALNTGLTFPLVTKVAIDDLEIVEVNTKDLMGHSVTITKSDYSQVDGCVIKVNEQKIYLDLAKGNKGVETNVLVTILDKNGIEHMGTLFVK